MATISVALCTFNGEQFIEQQLRSIVAQTHKPTEIIVSDDGSTDATLDIVRSLQAEYGHNAQSIIRIFDSAGQLGVTANFQRAIEATGGDLIALSDQDDVWHPDRISAAISAFETRPQLLLHHSDARLVDEAGAPLDLNLFEALRVSEEERATANGPRPFDAYIRRNLATGATVMFRRALLDLALPFSPEWVHDEWLAAIAAAAGEIQLDAASLIDYRQHGRNQIGVKRPTLKYRIGRMLEPRSTRNITLEKRAIALAERLQTLSIDPHVTATARERARFDNVRANLPRNRLARLRPVLREYRAGSYAALSSQRNLDVLRDLLQPA